MASCRDLGQAMQKASEYLSFIGGPFDSKMVIDGNLTEIGFIPQYPQQPHISHCIDEALSSFIKIVRSITGKFIKLREVRLPYGAPAHSGEYRRIFSCPVLFDAPTTALVFHSRDLVTPIIPKQTPLATGPAPSPHSIYHNIDNINEYSKKISILLHEHLQKGAPCIKQMAKDLGMSVRCLQMKLSKEGETFSQIVKNVRKELAKTYLQEEDYSIDEITYLLGFSDPSVFHRAFKHWTGVTPGQYRNAS
jgi:AraC-like DNA-binding protein